MTGANIKNYAKMFAQDVREENCVTGANIKIYARTFAQDVREENFSPMLKQQPVYEDVRVGREPTFPS